MDIWKEVLCLGEQMDPKTKRWFKITPKRVKDAHKNVRRMLSRGVPLPAVWEHQDIEAADAPADADAIAEWKRNYARYTFGFIGNSRINDSGNLELRHDDVSDEDAAQLERVRSVSPKIYDGYCDSRGGEYEGTTVAHVAATPTPVQYWQKPWELSDPEALYLSYTPPEADQLDDSDDPEKCPPYSESFDDWLDGLDLSATETPDRDREAEPAEDEPVADDTEKKPEKKADDDKGGGANADLKAIVKALKDRFGAKISDKVSNWNELLIAIESNGESAPEPDADNGNPDDDVPGVDDTTAPAGGAPMVMSTLDKNENRRKRAVSYAKPEREDAVARINAALAGDGKKGRDPRVARQLLRRASAVDMSFTADFEATGPRWKKLLADIAAYEQSAPGVALKAGGVDLSATEAVPRPSTAGTDPADDENNPVLKLQRQLARQHSVAPSDAAKK